jgi:hypothetical protein
MQQTKIPKRPRIQLGRRYSDTYLDIFSLRGQANIPTLLDSTRKGKNCRDLKVNMIEWRIGRSGNVTE